MTRPATMDYTAILAALNNATLFDLFRLNSAIRRELENPHKLDAVRRRLREGQRVSYFEPRVNRLIQAQVLKVNKTRVLVRNLEDGKNWTLPFYFVNLDGVEADISPQPGRKLDRTQIKVGDQVSFLDRNGVEQFGKVIKLNSRTAGVQVGRIRWRVYYESLSLVLDGELSNDTGLIEGSVASRTAI